MKMNLKLVLCASITSIVLSACGSANAPIPTGTGGAQTGVKPKPTPFNSNGQGQHHTNPHDQGTPNSHTSDGSNKIAAIQCEIFETDQNRPQKWTAQAWKLLFNKSLGNGFGESSSLEENRFATPDLPLVCTVLRVSLAPGALWQIDATVKFVSKSENRNQRCENVRSGIIGTNELPFKNEGAISYDYTVSDQRGGARLGKSVILVIHPLLARTDLDNPAIQHQYCENYARTLP